MGISKRTSNTARLSMVRNFDAIEFIRDPCAARHQCEIVILGISFELFIRNPNTWSTLRLPMTSRESYFRSSGLIYFTDAPPFCEWRYPSTSLSGLV